MKSSRLSILVAAMLVLAGLRFIFPSGGAERATVEPTVRPPTATAPVPASAPAAVADAASSSEGEATPGNAFAVRVVAPPPAPVPPPVVNPPPVAAAAPPPPAPPAPPPPPLQVIGTYDDGSASAVFMATPSGTVIARPGSVLLAEYRVTGITAQQVTLTQESTQRTIQIPVPGSVPR